MTAPISTRDVQAMIRHWLSTPVNGYLGSDYGQDLKSLLQRPQADGLGDAIIQKLRVDVPIVGLVPAERINLLQIDEAPDKKVYCISIGGSSVYIDESSLG